MSSWLRCRLDRGMFHDEVAVTYPAEGDWTASVFVPLGEVLGEVGGVGKVRVKAFSRKGRWFAALPTPTREVVGVRSQDLTA